MITILNQPLNGFPLQTVDSATIYFQLDSNNSSFTNFKYINTITINGPNATASYTYKVPPRPTTGYGLFAASDILKTYVTYSRNPFITSITSTPECYVNYRGFFYEEYNPGKTFSDTVYSAGYLGLTFSTPHGFGVSDVITIDKDNKQLNPQYDGTASITGVPNAYQVITNKPWGQNSANEGGSITNVIKYSTGASSSVKWAFNGTRQYSQVADTFSNYQLSATTSQFLTNYNDTKKVFIDDSGTMGFGINTTLSTSHYLYVETYDINNTLMATYSIFNPVSSSSKSFDIPAYPTNLTAAGVSFVGVKYYSLKMKTGSTSISNQYLFEIVSNCSPYENYRIMFLNSLGKMDFWNFNYISRNTYEVDRTEFKKTLNYNYAIGDRGQTILSQQVQEAYYLSSDWITEYDSEYLKELIYSPEIYLMESNKVIPLVITDTNYEVRTELKDRLFCISLNVKTAYRQSTQNQ